MAAKNGGKNFWEKLPVNSMDTLGVKNFIKITQSHTVTEINAFRSFIQKFKMAGTLRMIWESKIALKLLYLVPF